MDVADINGAGKLFQKEENGDTGIGLNIVRTGKIGVKGLVIEYGEYSVVYGEYSPTPRLLIFGELKQHFLVQICVCTSLFIFYTFFLTSL